MTLTPGKLTFYHLLIEKIIQSQAIHLLIGVKSSTEGGGSSQLTRI